MPRYPWIVFCFALAILSGCKPAAPPAHAQMATIAFAKDGAWNWIEDPRAVHVEGQRNRTYAGWVTSHGQLQVDTYDHATGRIETVVLNEHWEVDDHDSRQTHFSSATP